MVGLFSPAAQLLEELLHHVFTVGPTGSTVPILSIRDQVRCSAVCRAWRRTLDPQRFPADCLSLATERQAAPCGHCAKLAEWACRTQPGIRNVEIELNSVWEELPWEAPSVIALHSALLSLQPRKALQTLTLSAAWPEIQRFLPSVGLFPRLTRVALTVQGKGSQLDASMLRALPPQLEELSVSLCERLLLVAGGDSGDEAASGTGTARGSAAPLLPSLRWLRVTYCARLELAATLPCLEMLQVEHETQSGSEVVLGAEGAASGSSGAGAGRLHLPRLRQFALQCNSLAADLSASTMPALEALALWGVSSGQVTGLATLRHLVGLRLEGIDSAGAPFARAMLAQAPPGLCALWLSFNGGPAAGGTQAQVAATVGQALAGLKQVAHLVTNSYCVLPFLGALPQLCTLFLPPLRLLEPSVADLDQLADMPGLLKVSFQQGSELTGEDLRRRLQVLRRVLPPCCALNFHASPWA